MRKLFFLLSTFILSVSAFSQDIYISELDAQLSDKNYETFQFIDMKAAEASKSPEAVIYGKSGLSTYMTTVWEADYPSENTSETIQHSIKHELVSKDYDMTYKNPDFYVTYGVFKKEGSVKGDFDYDNESLEARKVKKGTLMISIIDAESNKTVWMGLSDNALNRKYNVEEQVAIENVANILDRF